MSAVSSPCAVSRSGRAAADAFTDAAASTSASATGSAAMQHSGSLDSRHSSPCTPFQKRRHPLQNPHRGGPGDLGLDERDSRHPVAAAPDDNLPTLRPPRSQRREVARTPSPSPPRHTSRSSPAPVLPSKVDEEENGNRRHDAGHAAAPSVSHVTAVHAHRAGPRQPHPVTATMKSGIAAAPHQSADADSRSTESAETPLASRLSSVAASRAVGSAGPLRVPTSIRVTRHRADARAASLASPLGPESVSSHGNPFLHSPTLASSSTGTSTAGTEARHTEELVAFFTTAITGTIAMEAKRQAMAATTAAEDEATVSEPQALPVTTAAQRSVASVDTVAAEPSATTAQTRAAPSRDGRCSSRALAATAHESSASTPETRTLFTNLDALADVHDDVPARVSAANSPSTQPLTTPTPTRKAQKCDAHAALSSRHVLPLAEKSYADTVETASAVASAGTLDAVSVANASAVADELAALARTSSAVAVPKTRCGSPERDRPQPVRTVAKTTKADPHTRATATGAATPTTVMATRRSVASPLKSVTNAVPSPKAFASTVSSAKPGPSTVSSSKPVGSGGASSPKQATRKLAQTTRTATEVTSRLYQSPLTRPLAYFIRQASPPTISGTAAVSSGASPPCSGNGNPAARTSNSAEPATTAPPAASREPRALNAVQDAARQFQSLQRALAAFVFPNSPSATAKRVTGTATASSNATNVTPAATATAAVAKPAPTAARGAASPTRTVPLTRMSPAPTARTVMPAIATSARGKVNPAKEALPATPGVVGAAVLAPPPVSKRVLGAVRSPIGPRK